MKLEGRNCNSRRSMQNLHSNLIHQRGSDSSTSRLGLLLCVAIPAIVLIIAGKTCSGEIVF